MIAKYGCVSDYSYSESPWHGGRKREVLEIYGRMFPCRPVLTVFQGGFTVRQDSTTAAFPAIRCRCGRRVVRRRSRPGHLRLRRSHFAMSSISPKFIPLIIKDIRFSNLLDPAYFATKRPSSPISSQVQQMSFLRAFDYQAFL